MPQHMTVAQARVVDPVLTTVAQGYQNAGFVGLSLFPVVTVSERGGKITTFGKESFSLFNTSRVPGANVKRVSFGYSGSPFALEQHAISGIIPLEELEDARSVPGIDLAAVHVSAVQESIGLRLEYAQATLAATAANYPAGNKITLSGTAQWSDQTSGVSDPVKDIMTGKEAIRAKIGKRPNTMVIGPLVWAALNTHPKIVDRLKYTGRDSLTVDILANLFDVQKVIVGDAIFDNNGTFVDVWGKNVILAYTITESMARRGAPSFGYTYRLTNCPFVEDIRYDGDIRSWLVPVVDEVAPVIACANAGYLISSAVA